MKLVILSGRSGSGKTTALQAFEDLGYYCVDNLPIGLLPTLASQLQEETHNVARVAVGIDARNLRSQLPVFDAILQQVKSQGVATEIIFLDAHHDTLLKRFSATRRRHPLSDQDMSLSEAIEHEGRLLECIQAAADLLVDTDHLEPHTLRNLIRDRVAQRGGRLSLLLESFGFKNGVPSDADLVMDARVLPNPHWDPLLRPFDGRDLPIIEFLNAQSNTALLLDDIERLLLDWLPRYEANDRTYMTVAVGCTGGQHRSVFVVEQLARRLEKSGWAPQVRHLQLSS
ncbi:RNase adapter RapZ [Isoalcanivorax beigongshangi]|uniref:RNase adapter RapZ n=1 Tax=Isoalcanivorax beigongshangi TaxID=3238810 RepID=A0ABV4AKT8_9GAMM